MGKVTSIRKAKEPSTPTGPVRPMPPADLGMESTRLFAPALALKEWAEYHLIAAGAPLHNPDHAHLADADLEFLWAAAAYPKQGRVVLGTAEQVTFRAGGWTKLRQEAQMLAWFGRVPAFLITIAADFASQCSDTEFMALLEHELYHVSQKTDAFTGAPMFDKESGLPKLFIRGHDVEEFVGVVRRYGAPATGMLRDLVNAAAQKPEVAPVSIAASCGTCMKRAA